MKKHEYILTLDLLRPYCTASLKNAEALSWEANLLEENGHYARSYFLAVASMEETGKAVIAFDAMGRNFTDSAVAYKIRKSFDCHSSKITAVFLPWLKPAPKDKNDVYTVVDLMIRLKHGREPSMYTDVGEDGSAIIFPSDAVRPIAAKDCVRLAKISNAKASQYIQNTDPEPTTRTQDEFFAMKSSTTQKIFNDEDFWEYYVDNLEARGVPLEESVTQYHKLFFRQKTRYKIPDVLRDNTLGN